MSREVPQDFYQSMLKSCRNKDVRNCQRTASRHSVYIPGTGNRYAKCKNGTVIDEYDDISTKDQYKAALAAGLSKEQALAACGRMSRDNARTPMQWDDSANAGFTTGTPWIKVNDNYDKINAKSQVDDPDSIFSCYKKLVQLRKDYPVFVDGKFTLLLEDDENIFAYSRKNEEKTMIVVCNFFDKEIPMPLAKECEGMEVLISNYKDTSDMSVLRPYEARMYIR